MEVKIQVNLTALKTGGYHLRILQKRESIINEE